MGDDLVTRGGVVGELGLAVPGFRGVIDEHLVDHDGDALPHLLFWDLSQFVLRAFLAGDVGTAGQVVGFVARAWRHGDEYVRNLVAVSFVENFIDTEAERRFAATWPADLQEVARELSSGGLA